MKARITRLQAQTADQVLETSNKAKVFWDKNKKHAPAAAGIATFAGLSGLAVAKAMAATKVVPVAAGAAGNGMQIVAFKSVAVSMGGKILIGTALIGCAAVAGAFVYEGVKAAIQD